MTDRRDLRNPQKLGEAMLNHMQYHKALGMSDEWPQGHRLPHVPNYPQDESMCTITAREYRAELEQREDKYAKSTLAAIDGGYKLDDDPSGN